MEALELCSWPWASFRSLGRYTNRGLTPYVLTERIKCYKSNKQFNEIFSGLPWQLFCCDYLEGIQNFQIPCSPNQVTWRCGKIHPGWYLCPLLPLLPALTHSERVFMLTQEHSPAPTSKLCPCFSQAATPWHQGPGNPECGAEEGQRLWWACQLGPAHPVSQGEHVAKEDHKGPLKHEVQSYGSLT